MTPWELGKTLFFQIGILGFLTFFVFVYVVPWLSTKQGLHSITEEERKTIQSNPVLRAWFRNPKRWFDYPLWTLIWGMIWGGAFICVTGVFYILLTDVGWVDASKLYGNDYAQIFLMARASGQPNGAHLPSYIATAALGVYVANRYRKGYFFDSFQAIQIVGFAVAIHESLWMFAYWGVYYGIEGLSAGANFVEDVGFLTMCVLLILGYWKSSLRTIPLKAFIWPTVIYGCFLAGWVALGLPISTVNNWQIGQGIYGTTQWFDVPWVNGVEILGWVIIAVSFGVVIALQKHD